MRPSLPDPPVTAMRMPPVWHRNPLVEAEAPAYASRHERGSRTPGCGAMGAGRRRARPAPERRRGLPWVRTLEGRDAGRVLARGFGGPHHARRRAAGRPGGPEGRALRRPGGPAARSEEHTSELQSRVDLVCRLLLEKKKRKVW